MAQRAASGGLDREQILYAGCDVARAQAGTAVWAQTSEEPFDFLGRPTSPMRTAAGKGLLVVCQVNANNPKPC